MRRSAFAVVLALVLVAPASAKASILRFGGDDVRLTEIVDERNVVRFSEGTLSDAAGLMVVGVTTGFTRMVSG